MPKICNGCAVPNEASFLWSSTSETTQSEVEECTVLDQLARRILGTSNRRLWPRALPNIGDGTNRIANVRHVLSRRANAAPNRASAWPI
jgi:hypothetical protein